MGLLGTQPPPRDFPERLGEFQLVRRIGSGGMGVVYEAEQESLGRRVALKVVRPELLYFEGARERFRREIEAVARLAHPAIVPVLASGEQDGLPFYAMELMRGRTVQEVCQRCTIAIPRRCAARTCARPAGTTETAPTRSTARGGRSARASRTRWRSACATRTCAASCTATSSRRT
jgi:aminoglycoside phosphotransferase (APT) family kinase protein